MRALLAAMKDAPGGPKIPEIHDITPPIDVPLPLWVKIAASVALLLILAAVVWAGFRYAKRLRQAPPPPPRTIALRELEQLRARLRSIEPYAFSIAVSEVLRRYVDAQYGLRAGRQTSPEFLASIQASSVFSDDDRALLADFLDRCDLIKFARIDASEATSDELLSSAFAFVQGGRL